MKINITVDVDWIEPDGSIEEEVKASIINGVKGAISKNCLAKVEKEASKQISEAIDKSIESATKLINKKSMDFFDEWMEKDITVTDKWGNTKTQGSVKSLIESGFEKLMRNGKVNQDGDLSRDGYSGTPVIDYLTGPRIQKLVTEKLKGLNKEIDKKIEELVNAGIRDRVSDKFAEMVIQTAKERKINDCV